MRFLILVSIIFAALASQSFGQVLTDPGQWYIRNQIYSMRVFNSTIGTSMAGRRGGRSGTGKSTRPPAEKTPVSVFRENKQPMLPAKLANGNAEIARQFESYLTLYRQTAEKDGFPANDVAYAFQYYVVNNYQIALDLVSMEPSEDPYLRNARDGFERIELASKKRLEQVTMDQERTIFGQFRTVFTANPDFAKLTDAQKQEMTELLAILFGVNYDAYLGGIKRRDDRLQDEARRLARESLEKLLGVNFGQLRITNNGLEY